MKQSRPSLLGVIPPSGLFAVLALLGWGIGAFAGGIQVAIEVLIRPDARSSA